MHHKYSKYTYTYCGDDLNFGRFFLVLMVSFTECELKSIYTSEEELKSDELSKRSKELKSKLTA